MVMEQILGRKLLDNECVHHRNGNKLDNRPENLELWTEMQPSGQRATDMIKWAEDFIDEYKNALVS